MEKREEVMVSTQGLTKTYPVGEKKITVLSDITLQIKKATFAVICGPSGSGKTALLNIIGGIDRPTKGQVIVAGQELNDKDEDFLSEFRCTRRLRFSSLQLSFNFNRGRKCRFPHGVAKKKPKRDRDKSQ